MRDCQVNKKAKMIKTSKAKEFGKVAADKGIVRTTDDESITGSKEVGF